MAQPQQAARPNTAPAGKPSKQQVLMKLAGKRVPRTLNMLKLVENLANYGPTDSQKTAILTAIDKAVSRIKTRFASPTMEANEEQFKLPS